MNFYDVLVKQPKKLTFHFIIFEKFENSHFIEFITLLKMLKLFLRETFCMSKIKFFFHNINRVLQKKLIFLRTFNHCHIIIWIRMPIECHKKYSVFYKNVLFFFICIFEFFHTWCIADIFDLFFMYDTGHVCVMCFVNQMIYE